MSRFRALLLCALACNCNRVSSAQEHRITDPKKLAELRTWFMPEAYVRPEDQKRAERWRDGYEGPFPCAYEVTELGTRETAELPTDKCFKMTQPRRMQGLWRNDFEGQAFCALPARACPSGHEPNEPGVAWIEFASPLPGSDDTPPGGLYAIDFIGRQTAYPGHYGGYGFYNEDVIVDRVLSIRIVEPPRRGQMTRQNIQSYLKDCAGKTLCMPNSEVSRLK
jgi:hypothetical protein